MSLCSLCWLPSRSGRTEEAIEEACNKYADEPAIAAQLEELAMMQESYASADMFLGDMVCAVDTQGQCVVCGGVGRRETQTETERKREREKERDSE